MKIFAKKKKRGFTLIELLVVIAIIGILAAIVLVSLGGARKKAQDARVQGDLSQVRSLAELLYNDAIPMVYDGLCEITGNTLNEAHATYGAQLGAIETDISTQNGGTGVACYASGDDYCVSTVLASGGNICVSSTGQTGNDACIAATTVCAP